MAFVLILSRPPFLLIFVAVGSVTYLAEQSSIFGAYLDRDKDGKICEFGTTLTNKTGVIFGNKDAPVGTTADVGAAAAGQPSTAAGKSLRTRRAKLLFSSIR